MEYEISDFRRGNRIELHPACDLWMRGARFGTVQKVSRKMLTVKLDMLARAIRVAPANVGKIID